MKKKSQPMIVVDGYAIPSESADAYIQSRENLATKLLLYAKEQGVSAFRGGQGSEDGEYIHINGEPCLYLLEPAAVKIWTSLNDAAEFMKAYQVYLKGL